MSQVTLKEAAEQAGYSYTAVYRRYKEGLIPVEKIGRMLVTDVEMVKTVMKAYEAGAERKRRKPGVKEGE